MKLRARELKEKISRPLMLSGTTSGDLDIDAPFVGECRGIDRADTFQPYVIPERGYRAPANGSVPARHVFRPVRAMTLHVRQQPHST